MKIKPLLIVFTIYFQTLHFYSQEKGDFLTIRNSYYKSKVDTQKIKLLNDLIENSPDDIWPLYNDTLIQICLTKIRTTKDSNVISLYKKQLILGYNNKAVSCVANNQTLNGIKYYELSLENLATEKNPTLTLIVLGNLGATYQQAGQYYKASEVYTKVLEKSSKLGNKEGIVSAYKFLGSLAFRIKDLKKTKYYYFNAIAICKEEKFDDDLSLIYNDLGLAYYSESLFDSCIYFLKESYHIRIKIKNYVGATKAITNVALAQIQKKDFEAAKQTLDLATNTLKLCQSNSAMAYLKQAYASYYLNQNQLKKAIVLGEEAWAINSKSHEISLKLSTTNVLYTIYLANKDYKKALEFYTINKNLHDSLNLREIKSISNEMEIKHEYEKKALVDSLKRNDEISLSNYKISQQLKQKYILIVVVLIVSVLGFITFRRFKFSVKQNKIIEKQKKEVDVKNSVIEMKQKEILDSINYAKRIQFALLAHADLLNSNLPEHFIVFKPKDIVSGDFYWATKKDDHFYLAVCDSTGHGVPGAFMSLLNISFLNEAINEKNILAPNKVLDHVRKRLLENMDGGQDGMDAVILKFSINNPLKVEYAAANNAPILIRKGDIIELPKDKMPVGKGEVIKDFELQTIELQKGDNLYFYTDGFADQFGGPKGKKFKYKQLNQLLQAHVNDPMNGQKEILNSTIQKWKGNLEQVDDICIIGIKI